MESKFYRRPDGGYSSRENTTGIFVVPDGWVEVSRGAYLTAYEDIEAAGALAIKAIQDREAAEARALYDELKASKSVKLSDAAIRALTGHRGES